MEDDLQFILNLINQKFTCFCGKQFNSKYSLKSHLQIHYLKKSHVCSQCQAQFLRKHDLTRHLKIHFKLSYPCLLCNAKFSRLDALKRHQSKNCL